MSKKKLWTKTPGLASILKSENEMEQIMEFEWIFK